MESLGGGPNTLLNGPIFSLILRSLPTLTSTQFHVTQHIHISHNPSLLNQEGLCPRCAYHLPLNLPQ